MRRVQGVGYHKVEKECCSWCGLVTHAGRVKEVAWRFSEVIENLVAWSHVEKIIRNLNLSLADFQNILSYSGSHLICMISGSWSYLYSNMPISNKIEKLDLDQNMVICDKNFATNQHRFLLLYSSLTKLHLSNFTPQWCSQHWDNMFRQS